MFKKLFYIVILVGLVGLTGCDDKLNLDPAQSLSTTTALGDLDGMETALFGAYNSLQSVSYYGRNYVIYPEIEGDQVYLSINNSNRFVQSYTYEFLPGNYGAVWNVCYSAILRVNNIINNIDALEGDAARKNQIKGEALAIRALCHFDLVRFFAKQATNGSPASDLGVPVVLEAAIGEPARNTVAEVYTQIILDLQAAAGILPNDGDIFRISKDAANALLARVQLYAGDYIQADALATALINSASYPLADDIVAAFAAPGSSEEIFTLRFLASETNGSDNMGGIYNPEIYGDIRVATDLLDLYEMGDSRLGFLYSNAGEIYQGKFYEQDGVNGLHSPKLLRSAELYLIAAEAKLSKASPDFAGALANINAVREKRGASTLMSVSLDNIFDERRRELAFEGHTTFDLWRTGRDMVRDQCNTGLELNVANCTISASNNFAVHPIPQAEIDVNQNMVQNPGY